MVADTDALAKQLEAADPDVKLMLQVREDVQGAFEILVQRYQNRLHGIMAHLIRPSDEAEDLTQEVFLRIYRARKGYKPRAKFATWLFTIANNLAMNHNRGRGRNAAVSLAGASTSGVSGAGIAADRIPGPTGTPSAQFRQLELGQLVQDAVNSLGDDQKLAVLLNKFEAMSYAEIAEVMGKTEPAIKSLLARARANLRAQLEPYLRISEHSA